MGPAGRAGQEAEAHASRSRAWIPEGPGAEAAYQRASSRSVQRRYDSKLRVKTKRCLTRWTSPVSVGLHLESISALARPYLVVTRTAAFLACISPRRDLLTPNIPSNFVERGQVVRCCTGCLEDLPAWRGCDFYPQLPTAR